MSRNKIQTHEKRQNEHSDTRKGERQMYVVHPKLGVTSTKLSRPVTSILLRDFNLQPQNYGHIYLYDSQVSLPRESILSDVDISFCFNEPLLRQTRILFWFTRHFPNYRSWVYTKTCSNKLKTKHDPSYNHNLLKLT